MCSENGKNKQQQRTVDMHTGESFTYHIFHAADSLILNFTQK